MLNICTRSSEDVLKTFSSNASLFVSRPSNERVDDMGIRMLLNKFPIDMYNGYQGVIRYKNIIVHQIHSQNPSINNDQLKYSITPECTL